METLFNTNKAAEYLGISRKSLERWRTEGTGPAFVKVGPGRRAAVRYRKADLDDWISAQTVTSTAEASARARS